MSDVNVDVKLGVNKFFVDESNAHIVLKRDPDPAEFAKLEKACPAGLYRKDDSGKILFDHAGCLECGTCRILAGKTILEKWEYPQGSFGVEYRHG
jgi:ferredoxin-like protein FixX